MSALIEFDEVCKYYQMGDTLVKAADHISMKIDRGEFVAIVGQSGSGKSTCMLTLLENVEVPLIYAGVGGSERRRRAIAALEQVGLGSKLRNKPNQLSGGQQQRVSIARALVRNPPIILADEPTGALDSHTGREVLGMLQELHKQGHTVVLITHDNSIAVQAERIIRLEDGVVVYDGDAHAPEAVVQPNLMMSAPKAGEEGAHA